MKHALRARVLTSASLVLSCPGCFLAKSLITSGVLKAWLMAAWIAWKLHLRRMCTISHTHWAHSYTLDALNKQQSFCSGRLSSCWHTSCIPLSSSTSVISPVMIFFRESLNSFSCSKVSFFVSSYSSSSSSSLKHTTKAKLTFTGINKQFLVWSSTWRDVKFDVQSLSKWHFYRHSSRSCSCCISLSSCSSKFCLNFPVSDFPREAILLSCT